MLLVGRLFWKGLADLVDLRFVICVLALREKEIKYSFHSKQVNGTFQPAELYNAEISTDSANEADIAIRKNKLFIVHCANGVVTHGPSFEDIARDMWIQMSEGEDLCCSKETGGRHKRGGVSPRIRSE